MKIENDNNKFIIYLFNEKINIDNLEELNHKIKEVFIKIMKRSNYNFFGYSIVKIYHNKNYGIILEVDKISDSEMRYHIIDLKIIVYKNISMYLEFDDYFFITRIPGIIMCNNKYYLKIDNKINLYKYIEFGKIRYKNDEMKLIN